MDMASWDKNGKLQDDESADEKKYNKDGVGKRFKLKFKHNRGDTWLIQGKAEDVFFYITTEYQGNSTSGKESPNSDISKDWIMENFPEIYDFYAKESVNEVKYYVKGGFTFKLEGKPKRSELGPDTLVKGKQKKMWPSVKIVFVKSKDHYKATGDEKDLERMAWAVDQSKHMRRTSGRDSDGHLVKESWLDAKKIQLKYRKEIAYIKKNQSGSGSKKEQELLDAITSILMNKEKGDWKDPDFSDIQALELIWDDEWKRLK
jgi:hypothetical protein